MLGALKNEDTEPFSGGDEVGSWVRIDRPLSSSLLNIFPMNIPHISAFFVIVLIVTHHPTILSTFQVAILMNHYSETVLEHVPTIIVLLYYHGLSWMDLPNVRREKTSGCEQVQVYVPYHLAFEDS